MAYKPSQQTINKRQHCKPPSITVTQTESDGDPSYSPSTAKEDEPWARPAGHMHAIAMMMWPPDPIVTFFL